MGQRIILCTKVAPHIEIPHVGLWVTEQRSGISLHQSKDDHG